MFDYPNPDEPSCGAKENETDCDLFTCVLEPDHLQLHEDFLGYTWPDPVCGHEKHEARCLAAPDHDGDHSNGLMKWART